MGSKYEDSVRNDVINKYSSGMKADKIAGITGIPFSTVTSWVREAGIKRPPKKGHRGRVVYSHNFKKQVAFAEGDAVSVAVKFNVAINSVRNWRKQYADFKQETKAPTPIINQDIPTIPKPEDSINTVITALGEAIINRDNRIKELEEVKPKSKENCNCNAKDSINLKAVLEASKLKHILKEEEWECITSKFSVSE